MTVIDADVAAGKATVCAPARNRDASALPCMLRQQGEEMISRGPGRRCAINGGQMPAGAATNAAVFCSAAECLGSLKWTL
jgi:hypothetical protein